MNSIQQVFIAIILFNGKKNMEAMTWRLSLVAQHGDSMRRSSDS